MRVPVHRYERDDDQAMTPMIDVVFLLLIFFICASSGQVIEAVLPTQLNAGKIDVDQPPEQEPPPLLGEVWLTLKQSPTNQTLVELNDTQHDDLTQLQNQLTQLAAVAQEIPVILDISGDVPMGKVIAVYDICRIAKFDNVQFAASPRNVKGE